MNIPGYDSQEKAQKLIDDSTALIEQYKTEGKALPTLPKPQAVEATSVSSGSAKSQAEERLKEELEQLKSQEESAASQVETVETKE